MQELIEVGIGLVFVFLIISLIVTAINEIISRLLRMRARMLWRGIRVVIDDPGLREKFYANGLIVNAKRAAAAEKVSESNKGHPSYIAPRNFAKALTMSLGLEPSASAAGAPSITLAEVRKTVGALPDNKIKDVLISSLSDAGAELQKFEKSLETWYQDAMDRLAGAYKRNKQALSFGIGLFIAVALNVDALDLAVKLNSDDETRAALVESAVTFAAQNNALELCGAAVDTEDTDDQQSDEAASQEGDNEKALADVKCLVGEINDLSDELATAPIGWPDPDADAFWRAEKDKTWDTVDWKKVDWLFAFAKVLGWLTTAFAVTLGAPFWFDLLKRFVNIRSSGEKPERPAPQA